MFKMFAVVFVTLNTILFTLITDEVNASEAAQPESGKSVVPQYSLQKRLNQNQEHDEHFTLVTKNSGKDADSNFRKNDNLDKDQILSEATKSSGLLNWDRAWLYPPLFIRPQRPNQNSYELITPDEGLYDLAAPLKLLPFINLAFLTNILVSIISLCNRLLTTEVRSIRHEGLDMLPLSTYYKNIGNQDK